MDDSLTHRTYQASAAVWPFTTMSTLFFFMRMFARARLNKETAGWDDAVLLVSWMLDIVRSSVFQVALDATRRVTPENPESITTAAFWVIFVDTWAFLSIALPKLAVGILIIRVFNPQPGLKYAILTVCVVLNILAIAGFIITFVQCDPVATQWDPFNHPEGKCWNRNIQIIYSCSVSGLSAFLDLAFTVYPSIMIWRLQMPVLKKLLTMMLMGLGVGSFAFAIVKLVSNTTLLGTPTVNQLLYDGVTISIWNSIENEFVLSAACLPSVPTFFRAAKSLAYSTKFFSLRGYNSSYNTVKSKERSTTDQSAEAIELAMNGQPPAHSHSDM